MWRKALRSSFSKSILLKLTFSKIIFTYSNMGWEGIEEVDYQVGSLIRENSVFGCLLLLFELSKPANCFSLMVACQRYKDTIVFAILEVRSQQTQVAAVEVIPW